jgi:hypothetical protein
VKKRTAKALPDNIENPQKSEGKLAEEYLPECPRIFQQVLVVHYQWVVLIH